MRFCKEEITPVLEGGSIPFPQMARARQTFPDEEITDWEAEFERGMKKCETDLRGKRIAITVGSRGIWKIAELVKTLIDYLHKEGAIPFIVAAMGSHGGASEEGQKNLIAGYGIREETMGVPVVGRMDVVELGEAAGVRVFCQKDAYEADGIIVMNKIKPHADFKGELESGLSKMMVVGLGKHKGATEIHRNGFARMKDLLEPAAALFLEKAPVLLGIGIIENAYDRIMELAFVRPEELLTEEKKMLRKAKENMAGIHLSEIDVLLIDKIGKNISGEGMDPNVTGRPGSYLQEGFSAPNIQKIVIFGMTEETHNNGVGVGMADITTLDLVNKIDLTQVYTNAVTSTLLGPARLPVIAATQKDALELALRTCYNLEEGAKVVWIPDTAHLDVIYVSKPLEKEINERDDIEIISDWKEMKWSKQQELLLEMEG